MYVSISRGSGREAPIKGVRISPHQITQPAPHDGATCLPTCLPACLHEAIHRIAIDVLYQHIPWGAFSSLDERLKRRLWQRLTPRAPPSDLISRYGTRHLELEPGRPNPPNKMVQHLCMKQLLAQPLITVRLDGRFTKVIAVAEPHHNIRR